MEPSQLERSISELLNQNDYKKVFELDIQLDSFFGIAHKQKLEDKPSDLYFDISQEALSTSYIDYWQLLNDLPRGEMLVDLGAGYARGTLLSTFLKMGKCLSLELDGERVSQVKNALKALGGDIESVQQRNLLLDEIPKAYAYYLYFPKNKVLNRILVRLLELSKNDDIFLYVCESHGDVLEYLDLMPQFFKRKKSLPLSVPRHNPEIIKYQLSFKSISEISIESLPSWLLFNASKEVLLSLEINHHSLGKINWLIPSLDIECLSYNNELALNILSTGRIVTLTKEVSDIQLKKITDFESQYTDLFDQQNSKKVKILFNGVFHLENRLGQITSID